MDIEVQVWLRDGHVWHFRLDENDEVLIQLISALPGADADELLLDGVIQIDTPAGERLHTTRRSLVALFLLPITNELRLAKNGSRKTLGVSLGNDDAGAALIDVAVTTVHRPGDYVHQLISGLGGNLRVRLVVGTPECDYLKRYQESPFIEIVQASPREWNRFRECGIHQRAAWNYWRAMNSEACSSRSKGLLVLEDDVVPVDDWARRFYEIIDRIEARQSGPYILALYAAAATGLKAADDGMPYVPYPPDRFFGSQAIYYPEPVRKAYAKNLKQNGVDSFGIPYDFLISEFSKKHDIAMFVAIPCLFQHIGEVSTGLAGFFHTAVHI